MFRLRCILHASKIREKRASRASVDSDRQRRNRQSGTDTCISGIFNSIPARKNFHDICLSQRRFFLFLFYCLFLLKYAGPPTLPSTRPFFPFIRPRFNQEFRLFEQRHEYYSADYTRFFRLGSALRDFRRSLPIGIFFENIYIYSIYVTV